MNRLTILFFALFLGLFVPASAQENTTDEVVRLLKAGNSAELSQHFIPNIDLTILETDDVFSRAQAEQILKNFFKKHRPTDLQLEHQGTSKLDDRYRIGKLKTKNGAFRLTFFMKKVEDRLYIKQLRIEEYNDDF